MFICRPQTALTKLPPSPSTPLRLFRLAETRATHANGVRLRVFRCRAGGRRVMYARARASEGGRYTLSLRRVVKDYKGTRQRAHI